MTEVLQEINRRRIGLTFVLDVWLAHVETVKHAKPFTPPVMQLITAKGGTVEEAVNNLVEILDAELFEQEAA